ncbi:MBL fold metallo-hydrolase [Bacillus sonorensis]|uniref:MBL fold metallo-hydrolase n=1 Tax=Bacillus sonorensis TaxID=119858 RepID=UPI00049538A4|nr:MBL fold metallo-hydrolase [Bacillus sonorensis]MCF7617916.1 MBL fold metallo-hydrolase [Bacillus sonorensis]MCY7856636.1 MBL fold metallo-hydrolase [Bacillus sonorensis]MCY8024195.1 MBL fold metallo-hydrolase [Bacillus sonorensis]MCY8089879.1 MBL fold metallo-hydrolase [Bacillus sonorensis]MCY8405044.1 MBL fold metallo-hydrolase [Bacillus sonorensis]
MKDERIIPISLPTPFAIGDVNIYLIKGEALTLIDAGPKTEKAAAVLKNKLAEHGLTLDDIDQVVLTHHHADHAGLLDECPGAAVVGHPFNEAYISQSPAFIEKQQSFFTYLFKQFGVPDTMGSLSLTVKRSYRFSCKRSLTKTVTEGSTIDGLEGWRVLETPGHASSHIALFHEKSGSMLGGDLLLKPSSSNPLLETPQKEEERSAPLLDYLASIKRLHELPLSVVYPGHGENITAIQELIARRLEKQRSRADEVYRMLSEKPHTAFEICRKLFPAVYEKELFLTMSETVGQLDDLQSRGLIASGEADGIFYYHIKRVEK